MVVALPSECRFNTGELHPAISEIRSRSPDEISKVMNDPTNWVGLLTHFGYETALSDYIAAYPHRLEDGLLPHPNDRVRERIFGDRSRLDVLLTDRDERPVIVECKQSSPTLAHLEQLRGYMKQLKDETNIAPRGILVHGGSKKLRPEIAAAARNDPRVEIVQYSLDVDFSLSF
jgi:RecB family endonuclease NucS